MKIHLTRAHNVRWEEPILPEAERDLLSDEQAEERKAELVRGQWSWSLTLSLSWQGPRRVWEALQPQSGFPWLGSRLRMIRAQAAEADLLWFPASAEEILAAEAGAAPRPTSRKVLKSLVLAMLYCWPPEALALFGAGHLLAGMPAGWVLVGWAVLAVGWLTVILRIWHDQRRAARLEAQAALEAELNTLRSAAQAYERDKALLRDGLRRARTTRS